MKSEPIDAQRPFRYADPRSLSRAWFDALYARDARNPNRPSNDDARAADGALAHVARGPAAGRVDVAARDGVARSAAPSRPPAHVSPTFAERGPEPGARADAATRRPPRAAIPIRMFDGAEPPLHVALRGADGTALGLVLEAHGGRVRAVAVCADTARERVADALIAARIALAARGIALHAQLTETGNA